MSINLQLSLTNAQNGSMHLFIHLYSFDHRTCNLMWNIEAIYASHIIENLMLLISSVYFAFLHHAFYITPCRFSLEHVHFFFRHVHWICTRKYYISSYKIVAQCASVHDIYIYFLIDPTYKKKFMHDYKEPPPTPQFPDDELGRNSFILYCKYGVASLSRINFRHTHTHTHIYIYIYIYSFVTVCISSSLADLASHVCSLHWICFTKLWEMIRLHDLHVKQQAWSNQLAKGICSPSIPLLNREQICCNMEIYTTNKKQWDVLDHLSSSLCAQLQTTCLQHAICLPTIRTVSYTHVIHYFFITLSVYFLPCPEICILPVDMKV